VRSNLKLFEQRVQGAYDLLERIPHEARRGAFLDLGCGIGNGVIAALKHGASIAVGIDANLKEFAHEFAAEELPQIVRHFGADPRRALFIEASVFDMQFSPAPFGYALMQDSAEHVPQPARFIQYVHDALEPGGYFVLDTSPLYYSPEGHHLFHCFDVETDPWPHLRADFEARILAIGLSDWHQRNLRALNKVTHQELVDAFKAAGFAILAEERGTEDAYMVELFRKYGHLIDPSLAIRREWLFEQRITVVARKAPGAGDQPARRWPGMRRALAQWRRRGVDSRRPLGRS
jgi:SAM-dependent methyltransferase